MSIVNQKPDQTFDNDHQEKLITISIDEVTGDIRLAYPEESPDTVVPDALLVMVGIYKKLVEDVAWTDEMIQVGIEAISQGSATKH